MRNAHAAALVLSTPIRLPSTFVAALVIGSLDWVSCSVFWAFRGVPMWRVAQGPASWLVGERAYSLGTVSVLLGATVMYAMAALSFVGYQRASEHFPVLLRQPLRWGAMYGALLYALLSWVVIPLSAAPVPHTVHYDWMSVLLLIYVCLIGIPCALFARLQQSPH